MAKDTLHLVLSYHWFDKIKCGQKFYEYRNKTPYWDKRFMKNNYKFVRFQRGYSKRPETMIFQIKSKGIIWGENTDLNVKNPVYAIGLGKRII